MKDSSKTTISKVMGFSNSQMEMNTGGTFSGICSMGKGHIVSTDDKK